PRAPRADRSSRVTGPLTSVTKLSFDPTGSRAGSLNTTADSSGDTHIVGLHNIGSCLFGLAFSLPDGPSRIDHVPPRLWTTPLVWTARVSATYAAGVADQDSFQGGTRCRSRHGPRSANGSTNTSSRARRRRARARTARRKSLLAR